MSGSVQNAEPLIQKVFWVTRPAVPPSFASSDEDDSLIQILEAMGAKVFRLKVLRISPSSLGSELELVLKNLSTYDWVVFTSSNGVFSAIALMQELRLPLKAMNSRKIASIGPSTSNTLSKTFRKPDLEAIDNVQESLASKLANEAGNRILLLRANLARKALPDLLKTCGKEVEDVIAYRTERNPLQDALPSERPDGLIFTSSESALAAFEILQYQSRESLLLECPIFCIGPITAQTVKQNRFKVAGMAKQYNTVGLVESIVDFFNAGGGVNA